MAIYPYEGCVPKHYTRLLVALTLTIPKRTSLSMTEVHYEPESHDFQVLTLLF